MLYGSAFIPASPLQRVDALRYPIRGRVPLKVLSGKLSCGYVHSMNVLFAWDFRPRIVFRTRNAAAKTAATGFLCFG